MLIVSSEKAARIKAARDEAQAEISKFRQQMEQEFQTAQFGVHCSLNSFGVPAISLFLVKLKLLACVRRHCRAGTSRSAWPRKRRLSSTKSSSVPLLIGAILPSPSPARAVPRAQQCRASSPAACVACLPVLLALCRRLPCRRMP